MRRLLLFCACLCALSPLLAQESTFPVNGVDEPHEGVYAFIHANIQQNSSTMVQNATLLIRKGKVEAVGTNVTIPKDAIVVDVKGKYICPSLIDLFSSYGMPAAVRKNNNGDPKYLSDKKGAYGWNEAIIPEFQAHERFQGEEKKAEEYRKMGFGAVLAHQNDGIAQGTGTLVSLLSDREHLSIIKDKASAHYSFNKGSSTQDYPSSQMGTIALLRQSYLDAQWYKNGGNKEENNISLDYWNRNQSVPQIFEANGRFNILRADKVGDEFGVQYLFKSSGDDYMRAADIKKTGGKLIIPVNFPKPYDVSDPYEASLVQLDDMMQWEMAPANAAMLSKAGVPYCFTSADLAKKEDFLKNIRKAMKYGLTESQVLEALFVNPAQFIGVYDQVGSLEPGKLANFLICSKPITADDCILYQNWVQGHAYVLNAYDFIDVRGKYNLNIDNKNYVLRIGGSEENPEANIFWNDSSAKKAAFERNGHIVNLALEDTGKTGFSNSKDSSSNYFRLEAQISDDLKKWSGRGMLSNGTWVDWTATLDSAFVEKEKKKTDTIPPTIGKVLYPFLSYGNEQIPTLNNYLIKNATVWTNESVGNLENTDVLVLNGKIAKIGKGLSASGAKVIDGSGKFLTNGIIDEHSHICISNGVNEGAQASSSEVRIGDVINPDDINLYRQLSGGVIAAQLLHGSANPIGGQSALVKLRWGVAPEAMKIAGADGFIKFALGENVKQSNWGDKAVTRYPQSRMGVEQTYMNYFSKAHEYSMRWKANETAIRSKSTTPLLTPRRDLELEALAEIMDKKRFITCHSYVQSEINMLMHVADTFGFKVNTFTHILEGYKVADKMKAHGVNASTFADWWAYKYEVIDAIPYNAYILNKMGVNTCINSDDAEMGRRLNQEAAKCMKYGGLTEMEAWKLVTLNPAIALHLDKQMGSIKEGKDADLVLWNANPLSIYAQAEKTWVDGVCYYDRSADAQKRIWIQNERARLIAKMMEAKKNGAETQHPAKRIDEINGCMGHETHE